MTSIGGIDQFLNSVRDWGLPIVVVALLIFEILVPRGRLKDKEEQLGREEQRSIRAMDIAEKQVEATKELSYALKGLKETIDAVLQRPPPRGRG